MAVATSKLTGGQRFVSSQLRASITLSWMKLSPALRFSSSVCRSSLPIQSQASTLPLSSFGASRSPNTETMNCLSNLCRFSACHVFWGNSVRICPTCHPVSSKTSRVRACSTDSPGSTWPPARSQQPGKRRRVGLRRCTKISSFQLRIRAVATIFVIKIRSRWKKIGNSTFR